MDPRPPPTTYAEGIRQLVAGLATDAVPLLRAAAAADPGFALAHAGLATALSELGDDEGAAVSLLLATRSAADASRRERHHVAVVALVLRGCLSRASALGREHLDEFPDDMLVRHLLTRRCDDAGDLVTAPPD